MVGPATGRTAPCLLVSYSIVALLAYRLYRSGGLSVSRFAWYDKPQATFSDALDAVRYHLWEVEHFSTSPPNTEHVQIPRVSLQTAQAKVGVC